MKRFVLVLCILPILFSACGKAEEAKTDMSADKEIQKEIEDIDPGLKETDPETVELEGIETSTVISENTVEADEEKAALMKEMFGENCIAEQTFEVELSEYEGEVWFVPFYPSETDESFYFQIIQNGEVLFLTNTHNATSCVPEGLLDEGFTSLDAVAFFDVNYDGETDIVLIETYGDTSFAIVYYGEVSHYDDRVLFYSQEALSYFITDHVKTLTIPEIQQFLTKGTANGEFTDYREAYRTVCRLDQMENEKPLHYNLIYVDNDDVPELVTGVPGYYVSLYTYHDGMVYELMDQWGYGAFGNTGYDYIPKKNLMSNFDQDHAGLVGYTTYMTINSQYVIETVTTLKFDCLDCVDENGDFVDENATKYSIDGEEVSEERYDAAWKKYGYEAGEYEYIEPQMDLDTLLSELSK